MLRDSGLRNRFLMFSKVSVCILTPRLKHAAGKVKTVQ